MSSGLLKSKRFALYLLSWLWKDNTTVVYVVYHLSMLPSIVNVFNWCGFPNYQREKEEALNKILQLEKQLDAKQKLEMEIEELKGKLQVMKHLGDQDDAAIKKKMEEMSTELEDKIESLEDMESMNLTLIVKERQSNDELQEARKELIEVRSHLLPLNYF